MPNAVVPDVPENAGPPEREGAESDDPDNDGPAVPGNAEPPEREGAVSDDLGLDNPEGQEAEPPEIE